MASTRLENPNLIDNVEKIGNLPFELRNELVVPHYVLVKSSETF